MASNRFLDKQNAGLSSPHFIRLIGKNITVKPLLSAEEMANFINSVMGVCIDKVNESIIPEFVDLAIRANTVLYYTDMELPDSPDAQIEILYGTDIYNMVRANIKTDQLDALIHAVELCIRGTV